MADLENRLRAPYVPIIVCPRPFTMEGRTTKQMRPGMTISDMLTSITQCFDLPAEALKTLGIDVPIEGACLIGEAQLFNSRLADKAWEAIQRGIFSHVCAVLFRQPNESPGTGSVVEVSLVTGDFPGCRNARILKTWE